MKNKLVLHPGLRANDTLTFEVDPTGRLLMEETYYISEDYLPDAEAEKLRDFLNYHYPKEEKGE